MSRYDPIIADASRRFGVPESYIRSVMRVESGGRPGAVSSAGAGGLMQIMPPTYEELRGKHGLGPDRFDPVNNIMAGTAYLRENNDRFGGDWDKTFAAYNAGPGRVQRGGPSDRAWLDRLPAETRAYVPKVQAGIQGQGADVNFNTVLNKYAGTMRPGAALTEEQLLEQARGGSLPGQRPGLLDVDSGNNWLDGIGGLLGEGQTGSQPPGPSISPLQYMLGGAGNAVGQLAGVTNRRVGIGELLGALGGGLTQGVAAGQQAQRQQRSDVREEQESRLNNVYKAAMTRKALMPEQMNLGDRFKVAGRRIFDAATQTWIDDPNAGPDQGGPLAGTGPEAQFSNAYIALHQKLQSGQQLTPQEQLLYGLAQRHLNQPKFITGPDGRVREVPPDPLPTLGGPAAAPPPGAATPPGPLPPEPLISPPPPAPAVAPPAGRQVKDLTPPIAKEIPQTVQNNLLANINALRAAENAIASTSAAPDATGLFAGALNMLPGGIVNKAMPGGTKARADISDLGSLKIHDRSGAAVTAAEFPRLAPFVPLVSDDAETVQIKLKRFREELAAEIRDQEALYGADQGYKPNPILQEFTKTGRAPRYEAPMEGAGGGTSGLSDDELRRKLGL